MNYKLSSTIYEKIKLSKKILTNCHYSPDPDSVGSATALYQVLLDLGKKVDVICPDDLPDEIKFLNKSEKIKKVDFEKFDFSKYDLFIVLDCGSWQMVKGPANLKIPKVDLISIDHHIGAGSEHFADYDLIDGNASSTSEVLFNLFNDWKVKIETDVAYSLLTGIYGDTGAFQYNSTKVSTFYVAGELVKAGADLNKIVLNLHRSLNFEVLRFWGELLVNMKLDKKYKFAYSALNFKKVSKYKNIKKAKSTAASIFSRVVKGTNFGIIMTESKKNVLSVSLRERNGMDVSSIAKELGGGGHKSSAAADMYGVNFDEAVNKVLTVARKHARKTS